MLNSKLILTARPKPKPRISKRRPETPPPYVHCISVGCVLLTSTQYSAEDEDEEDEVKEEEEEEGDELIPWEDTAEEGEEDIKDDKP